MIPSFIARMLAGERPVIFGDRLQSRDFTYVANVVAGNLAAAAAPNVAGKVYNLASGKSYSLLDLIAALNQAMGANVQPIFQPARVGDVKDSLADTTRAQLELGYTPVVGFDEGLRETVAYYRQAR